ncbi:MAG: hypothetical protein IKH15_08225 [Bacteroidales bacterium]|nr:hypothetical protein [Bacteroidales bacterium]MBR4637072.1 hypothetical protein [Bacteroidales bacterium]
MSRGKSTCKVLKEVRRKIADANGIPLQERECTHTGDCAGTCPYCESEVRYLERELSKRRALGKAVAVAGIALSAVSMAGCATSEPVTSNSLDKPRKTSGRDITDALSWMGAVVVENNGKPEACNPEKNKSKKEKKSRKSETYQIRGIVPMTDTLPKIDTAMMVTPSNPQNDEVIIGLVDDLGFQNWIYKEEQGTVPESIPGFTPAVFTEGKFEAWLRSQLLKFRSYMQDPRLDSVEIRFFVEEDGYVSLINILNMPAVYKQEDEAFRAKITAVISGSEWTPATVSGKPVSSIVTVQMRNLR